MKKLLALLFACWTITSFGQVAGDYRWSRISPTGPPTTAYVEWAGKNVIYVSRGDGATDTRTGLSKYDATRPFATLVAAQTAATSGDTILVSSGTFEESGLGKNGVNWTLLPGVVIGVTTGTGTTAEYIFGDGGVASTYTMAGWGRVVNDGDGSNEGHILSQSHASSNITFYAESVYSGQGLTYPTLFLNTAGTQQVFVNSATSTQGEVAVCGAGSQTLRIGSSYGGHEGVICNGGTQIAYTGTCASESDTVHAIGGSQYFYGHAVIGSVRAFRVDGGYQFAEVVTASSLTNSIGEIVTTGTMQVNINGEGTYSSNDFPLFGIVNNAGAKLILSGRIRATGSGNAGILLSGTLPIVELKNLTVITGGEPSISTTTGTGNVGIQNVNTNIAPTSVNIKGGTITVSTDVQ